MNNNNRIIAVTELVLILPAALFLMAVLARYLQPLHYDAQQIVTWYSGRQWTLWVLLICLPFTVLLTGCFTLLRNSIGGNEKLQAASQLSAATWIIVVTTLASGVILAVVGLHMLAN